MAALIAGVGALLVVEGGLFDATAATPHYPIVGWATHQAFIHSVRRRARKLQPPHPFTAAQVARGFREYEADCVACHGGPATARAHWVSGMTPTPPFLLDAARQWSPGELYWIVGRGVKMTAMPAWGEVRSEDQVWDVVAFLEALPGMKPRDYLAMRAAEQQQHATPTVP